ncbi:MAG: GIY-YIG nuclease family protein [Kiloniellales bacterium]
MSGIYRIRNLRTQKSYVGQAALSFEKRFKEHRHSLRNGKHHSRHLQRAWDRYGERAFVFEVIEEISRDQNSEKEFKIALREREQFHMDALQAKDPLFGYNISPRAGSQLGYRHSEESRRKMSQAGRGRQIPEKTRQKLSEVMKAKRITRSRAERDRLSARRAQLRYDEVFDALDMYEEGVPQEDIAERFGISLAGMHRIIRGMSYRRAGVLWCRARGVESLPKRKRAGVMFTKDDVFDILDRDKSGEMRKTIAAMYESSINGIDAICLGKYYKRWFEEWCRSFGVAPDRRLGRKTNKLSESDVRSVLKDLASGMKQCDIAKLYGVSAQTICDIKKGRIHKTIIKRVGLD